MTKLLEVRGVSKAFGGLKAVSDVSLEIGVGSVAGLIGPNGAGKSTLFNLIAGTFPADSGSVVFRGQDITALPSHRRAVLGIGRTFQIPRLFHKITVLENMLTVIDRDYSRMRTIFSAHGRGRLKSSVTRAMEVLEQFNLARLADDWAGSLSGGQQKLLSLAMQAGSEAPLVMLDEPAAGVNPTMVNMLVDHVREINAAGKTVFLVEHNLSFVERVAPHVFVMAEGKLLCQGSMAEIRENKQVQAAYIGTIATKREQSATTDRAASHA